VSRDHRRPESALGKVNVAKTAKPKSRMIAAAKAKAGRDCQEEMDQGESIWKKQTVS
jgi:hypothetical protein